MIKHCDNLFILIRKYVSECHTPTRMNRTDLLHTTEHIRILTNFKNTYFSDHVESRVKTTIFLYGFNPYDFKNRSPCQKMNIIIIIF